MQRISLTIEYDGTNFAGWQMQQGRRTIQAELEQALSVIANQPIQVMASGRTDAGVHALQQVLHFDTNIDRSEYSWVVGTNRYLPAEIRVLSAQIMPSDFHARYSALARWYRYLILNRAMNSALYGRLNTWHSIALNAEKMAEAAQFLNGHHDFSAFRAQGCQSKTPYRQLYFIEVQAQAEQIVIDICANAFLHHMVRNIVGSLMAVGEGKQPANWIQQVLLSKDRTQAGITAPPQGLYLAGIYYPEKYQLTSAPIFQRLPKTISRFD